MTSEFLGMIKLVLFVRPASSAGRLAARIFGGSVVWRVQSAKEAMDTVKGATRGAILVLDDPGWSVFDADARARLGASVREGNLGVCILTGRPDTAGNDAFERVLLPASDAEVVEVLQKLVAARLRASSRGAARAVRGRDERRRSILVVDDSALINRITEMILTQAGYRVRCIASPFELYDKTREEPADLVLVDYNMPLRGDKVIDVARRAGVTAPMVLYSNAPENVLRSAVHACGASGYITKGVPAEEVVRQLAEVFARIEGAA